MFCTTAYLTVNEGQAVSTKREALVVNFENQKLYITQQLMSNHLYD